jgi:hypothetical protein
LTGCCRHTYRSCLGPQPPAEARKVLYSYLSRIRRLTLTNETAARIDRRHAGHVLDIDADCRAADNRWTAPAFLAGRVCSATGPRPPVQHHPLPQRTRCVTVNRSVRQGACAGQTSILHEGARLILVIPQLMYMEVVAPI